MFQEVYYWEKIQGSGMVSAIVLPSVLTLGVLRGDLRDKDPCNVF